MVSMHLLKLDKPKLRIFTLVPTSNSSGGSDPFKASNKPPNKSALPEI